MKRKEFITLLGVGAGTVVVASCLGGCGKGGEPAPNPGNKVDFTFDVTQNQELTTQGYTIKNGIIIADNGNGYTALSGACTHQSNPLTYDYNTDSFPCSLQGAGHGSVFNSDGIKVSGPATTNLKKYNTTLNGNMLRVYES